MCVGVYVFECGLGAGVGVFVSADVYLGLVRLVVCGWSCVKVASWCQCGQPLSCGGQPPTGRISCLTDEPEKREEKPKAAAT